MIAEASCLRCADITKRFEQDVARGLWGDARIAYNAPSRRKRLRKTHIVLADPENPARTIRVPYADYPAPIVFYRMTSAGLLQGLPETLDISSAWTMEALSDDERNDAFERKYGMKALFRFRHVPQSFARLLAKIGYGQVLTSLDLDDFRPICLPYILGQKTNLSYIVGGQEASDPSDPGLGYRLGTAGFGTIDRLMLVAEIRLYANNRSPTYHVLVGEVSGRQNVGAVLQKLGVATIQLLSGLHSPEGPQHHWMPRCWPLPAWRP